MARWLNEERIERLGPQDDAGLLLGLPPWLGDSIPQVSATVAILVGALVLLGWAINVEALKRVFPGMVAMNPTTAMAFILSGSSLVLLANERVARWRLRAAWGCASAVALVGLLKLVGVLFSWDTGVDELLFSEQLESEAALTGAPNRMAPNTALNFFLLGLAMLLLDRPRRGSRRGSWPAQYLVLGAALTSLLALFGYAYTIESFYGVSSYIPMALHTALTFLALSVGILLARPDRGFVALLSSGSAGGTMARRLLPAIILIPALLGYLRLRGEQAGLYETELGVAIMVVLLIVILVALVGFTAHMLDRAESALRKSEARYRAVVDTASDAIVTMTENGLIHSLNPAAERIFGYDARELLGRPLKILMPKRFRKAHEAGFRRYTQSGEAHLLGHQGPVELAGLRKGGEEFPLELSIAEFREEGELLFTGIIRDISQRKQSEQAIRDLNENLEKKVEERSAQLIESENRLKELVGKIVKAQEEERRRVAYEVHDGLAQLATATHQHLQAFAHKHAPSSDVGQRKLERALELAQRTVKEARSVIEGLRPSVLDDFGLSAALSQKVAELRKEGWQISYEEDTAEEEKNSLSPEIETALYRVAQEALTNVNKHAKTTTAHLALKCLPGRVHLEVRDEGEGFDPSLASSSLPPPGESRGPGERVGLAGMRERVALLGGELRIQSEPGRGTRVIAEVPLQGSQETQEEGRDAR